MKTRLFALATLALALTACSNDDEYLNDGPVAATFTAEIYDAASTRASGTTWGDTDQIGITEINGTQYDNVPFILNNGTFEAVDKKIYIADTETHTYRAYYPYNAAGGILTVKTDAEAQKDQPAIDFLFATRATGDKDNPVVSFTDKTGEGGADNSFHHSMSQMTFTFEAGDGVTFDGKKPDGYTLEGARLTGTFNTADGTAAASEGDATAETLAMTLTDGSLTSSVILLPQTTASLTLVVSFNGQKYSTTLNVPEGALKAGNNYTYTVKLNNAMVEVSDATIAPWKDVDGGDVNAVM